MTIGVFDFNFDFASDELDFNPLSRDLDPAIVDIYEAQIGESATTDEHGQAVAVVAAGAKNDLGTHGVAFNAEVLAVDFFSGVNGTLESFNGITFHVSDPWTYLTDNGARVINKSIGFDEGDIIPNPPVVTDRYVVESDAIAVQNGALLVSSAGNNSDPEPSLSNLQTIAELQNAGILDSGPGAFIIVGAVRENLQIASFSDRAGVARDHYMVAPGVNIAFPWNGVMVIGSGTSFSAPHVVGAAAIIFERWPTLTGRDVMNILFDSATDLGLPGVDAIYGQGLLNLDAALQPLGTSTFAIGASSTGPLVTGTGIVLGSAFGDGGSFGASASDVMILDGFTRDFTIDLKSFVSSVSQVSQVSQGSRITNLFNRKQDWKSSSLRFGETGKIFYAFGENAWEREAASLRSSPLTPYERERDVVLEFSDSRAGLDLAAGIGRSLGDAMAARPFNLVSLTQAFSHPVDHGQGTYAIAGVPFADGSHLRLGISSAWNQGIKAHPVAALRDNQSSHAFALRYDRRSGSALFGLEVGALVEDGALLGSVAAGGLALTERSTTTWLTLAGQRGFENGIFLAGRLSAALTDPGSIENSLLTGLGNISSTSFSFGIGRRSTLLPGDALSFTVHQPLHVEQANLTFVSGRARDRQSGHIDFSNRDLSLSPSGRELALETAYQAKFGNWIGEANLAYSFDADHIEGQQEASVMLSITRDF